MGLGHNGTRTHGTQSDGYSIHWDIMGLKHNGTATQRNWDTGLTLMKQHTEISYQLINAFSAIIIIMIMCSFLCHFSSEHRAHYMKQKKWKKNL